MSDLTEQLRKDYAWLQHELLLQAADEIDRLREALAGLVGLIQLVRSREDCPVEIKQALTDHYRLDDALAALAKEAGQ